jgi:hypothetical protein
LLKPSYASADGNNNISPGQPLTFRFKVTAKLGGGGAGRARFSLRSTRAFSMRGTALRAFTHAARLLRLLRRPQNQAALRMRYLHRHWPGINPPLLQTAALPAGQLMEQGGEPCAEQKL